MSTLGRPNFFDIDKYLDCVEGMILADEVERAFWMLDNPPSFYRENPTERMTEIRQSLHKAMFTPIEYSKADREIEGQGDGWPARGEVVAQLVSRLNADNRIPNLMEISPGTHWLKKGLEERGLTFTYESRSLTSAPPPIHSSNINILICMELIEHLANPMEAYQAYLKFEKTASYLVLSVPLHTWGGGLSTWRGQALGHLRTFSPQEFFDLCRKMFGPGYDWRCHLSDTITLEGARK